MKVQICNGKTCKSRFCEYIEKRLNSDIEKFDLDNIIIEKTPCMGECSKGPNVVIDNTKYNYSDPAKISKIVTDKKR